MSGNRAPARRSGVSDMPYVVIVGGGFGGLYAAKALKRTPVRITLVDRHNYHLFQPMLYEVAGAALNASDIAFPIRSALRGLPAAEVLMCDVVKVDQAARELHLADGPRLKYDYCILAPGVETSYYGREADWEPLAPGLKTLKDGFTIRRRVLQAFERAGKEPDPALRTEYLTFVIVGGGPSGVEMAGIIAELRRHTLAKDFVNIDPREARVILLEGGPRILPSYPEKLSRRARECLQDIGVDVRENVMVENLGPHEVHAGGQAFRSDAIVWTAGTRGPALLETLQAPLDKAGRAIVEQDCSIPGAPNLFVIGDAASFTDPEQGVLPGVAPTAMQQARYVASLIKGDLAGKPRSPFRYVDKGGLAVIGRGRAVAYTGKLQFSGFLAWLIWAFIHIAFLVGFRNRVLVMIQWGWLYFWYAKGARIITGTTTPRRWRRPASGGARRSAIAAPGACLRRPGWWRTLRCAR